MERRLALRPLRNGYHLLLAFLFTHDGVQPERFRALAELPKKAEKVLDSLYCVTYSV